jgi:hypothetical protein
MQNRERSMATDTGCASATGALRETLACDGVVFVPSLLSASQLADVAAAFEWSETHPGPGCTGFPGDPVAWQDLSNPDAYEVL